MRTYTELSTLKSFEERFNYLNLNGRVGSETFGFDRYLNQQFYKSKEWRKLRNEIIVRDNACDLGIKGFQVYPPIIIHHMNPIQVDDILDFNPDIVNPEYLVCVSSATHKALHYGDLSKLQIKPVERTPGDTCPWK